MIKFTKRSRRAFSLVEILFAVIIIGVLTAVAVPSLFNNKGKADDSNAKQTLRAAYTLISTSLDDSGALRACSNSSGTCIVVDPPTEAGFINFLNITDGNMQFAGDKNGIGTVGTAINKGNVRVVGLKISGDYVLMTALGGKTGTNEYNCFGIAYDITGAQGVLYTRKPLSQTGCTTAAGAPTAPSLNITQIGDFPIK